MNELERNVLDLIAMDRVEVPVSSMSGKLKRRKKELAQSLDLSSYEGSFETERVYARVETFDKLKARGMRDGVEQFKAEHPKYGAILEGMIEEKRSSSETHLAFDLQPGKRLSTSAYMGVMKDLGFSEVGAHRMYPEISRASRKIARARNYEQRSILIG